MSDKDDKRYCTVDHADKQGERKAKNPNRLKLTRQRYGRWIAAAAAQHKAANEGGGD